MKIEIDAKELTALLDYIKGQREPIGSADDLAKSIIEIFHIKWTKYSLDIKSLIILSSLMMPS